MLPLLLWRGLRPDLLRHWKLGEHLACLGATLLYGVSGNFRKRFLAAAPPLAIAAGSQLAAAVLTLAALCTTFAYVLFFGLIARLGASRAMGALFLIPAFGMLWGTLFLDEPFTGQMAGSCAVILLGSVLTTGLSGAKAQPPRGAAAGAHFACELLRLGAAMAKRG